jgi:hypothetical protein
LLSCATLAAEPVSGEASFQLRGVILLAGKQSFSIHDTRSGADFWIEMGRTYQGIRPVHYDGATETLTVEHNGQTLALTLAMSDGTPLDVVSGPPPDWQMSTEDIDPDTPGKQSFQAARSRVKFSVGARSPKSVRTEASATPTAAGSARAAAEAAQPEADSKPAESTAATELNEAERVALEVYEKNHISTREPPPGVDVYYPVGPRR